MKSILHLLLFIFLFLYFSISTFSQFYSGSQMEFGKNRVQFDEPRLWQWYKFEKYNVYFYMGGKELAMYTAQQAKKSIEEIEKILDYNIDDKIELLVFNKQSDYKQSNIGMEYEEPYNIGGVTKIVGSKVFLYYEGDHDKLDRQIRAGIAEVLINQMMFGGNVKDMLKNSTLLNLPGWYIQGLVSYIANGWNTDIDNSIRDGIFTNKYKKFNGLDGQDAIYAGHSIWNYIAETYSESVISNILYMTKITRNVENAFLFVLGVSMKNMSSEWMNYYSERYNEKDDLRNLPEQSLLKKSKTSRVYQSFKISSDGKYAVYSTNELGQYKIWLYNYQTKKIKRILKCEQKLDRPADYSYPIIAWHPNSEMLSFITERKGEIHLSYYTLSTKKIETLKISNFEKILDFAYSDDGKNFVMSAIQKGQSDIFVYNIAAASYEQITKDIYDDLTPRFISNSQKIIFSSNRPGDTIRFMANYYPDADEKLQPMKQKDIFIYNYKNRSPILRRITNTPLVNESYPCEYDSLHLCFLGDDNGIRNRYLGVPDSAIAFVDTTEHYRYFTHTFPITNYSRNILEQDINLKTKKISEVVFFKKKYCLFTSDIIESNIHPSIELMNTVYAQNKLKQISKSKEQKQIKEIKKVETINVIMKEESKKDSSGIDINNYSFDKEPKRNKIEKEKVVIPPTTPDTSSKVDDKTFIFPQQRNYFIFFLTDYIVTQIDNSFLNASYQKFTGGGGAINLNPGFTGFFKIGLSDLFNDYKIIGGVRISADLNSNEYFLSYENRLKRLDKQIVLHRQALLDIIAYQSLIKIHTHEAMYVLKWPFTETAGLRGAINIRQDRTVFLSTDPFNMEQPNRCEYWGNTKMEYVFDNTRKRGLNLYYGTRYKLFAEYFRQIDKKKTDIVVLGMDVRNYKKIHRDFIWANRLAASTSFGKQKLIYYMGGVDNWISPRFNNNTPISTTENYAYQTLATPMRGFTQNIRNGNSFAVYNTELRLPLFRYLMNKPMKSDFLNNFQLVAFGDVGTAWTGKDPYSNENSLNTKTIGGPPKPVTVIIETRREPVVGGYGWGLRSRLLGYFIRLDWAWGWEDGKIGGRIFYWSFTLDF
ncbi:MAG: hypothetical protein V1781_08960 [Bacteroidota bacterium]